MTNQRYLEKAYTMTEAAAVLRICRRKLQDLVAQHPHYHINGRRKLFTESEIGALRTAMARAARELLLKEELKRSALIAHRRKRKPPKSTAPSLWKSIWKKARSQ